MNERMLRALYEELIANGASVVRRYPLNAIGVALTSGAAPYAYQAAAAGQTTVIAAVTNTVGMFVVGAGLDTLSAVGIYLVWVGRGAAAAALVAYEFEMQVTIAGPLISIASHALAQIVYVPGATAISMQIATAAGAGETARGHVLARLALAPVG